MTYKHYQILTYLKMIILDEVNSIIQDLYKSDLISDISLEVLIIIIQLIVTESNRIESVYIMVMCNLKMMI